MIVAVDRVEQFVGLLEHERFEGIDRLLPVPGTAVRSAKGRHDVEQSYEFGCSAVGIGHGKVIICEFGNLARATSRRFSDRQLPNSRIYVTQSRNYPITRFPNFPIPVCLQNQR